MRYALLASTAALMIGVHSQANAVAISSPDFSLVDSSKTAVYFSEYFDYSTGMGYYDVTNNVNNSILVGFGVTNVNTTAGFYSPYSTELEPYGFGGNNETTWMYDAITVNESNWDHVYLWNETAQDMLGDYDSFFSDTENTLNWYKANDGALQGGMSWDEFAFVGSQPMSTLYALISDENGNLVMVDGITPDNVAVTNVSEPGMIALLCAGLLALRRRRT